MIYDLRQTTVCGYATPVSHAHHVLRLTPVSRNGERVQVAALQIIPEPVQRREGQDFFGNRLTWIEIEEPHSEVTVKLAARVAVDAPEEPAPLATPPWEDVRDEAFATSDIGPKSPAHFLFPSRIVSLDPAIRDYVRQSFPAGRAILEASGGITLARVTELANAGVDAISVGALTHSSPAADIGLDFVAPEA